MSFNGTTTSATWRFSGSKVHASGSQISAAEITDFDETTWTGSFPNKTMGNILTSYEKYESKWKPSPGRDESKNIGNHHLECWFNFWKVQKLRVGSHNFLPRSPKKIHPNIHPFRWAISVRARPSHRVAPPHHWELLGPGPGPWLGPWWVGFLGSRYERDHYFRNTLRIPNHQVTIRWS